MRCHHPQSAGFGVPRSDGCVGMQHYILLHRNLIYNGVTGAKRLQVVVGKKNVRRYCSWRLKEEITERAPRGTQCVWEFFTVIQKKGRRGRPPSLPMAQTE
jgi:hypothetical protein